MILVGSLESQYICV